MSYELKDHQITTLIGPNGSGKSTLFKLLTRSLKPNKGQILLNREDIWTYPPKKYAQNVAIVHQQNQIYDQIQVIDLVRMGQIPYEDNFKNSDRLTKILDYLELSDLKNKDLSCLSGGQRQRVWLAVALMQDPEYLFLDEPTTYLDLHFQYSFLKLLRRLNKEQNLTICMILHDLNEALEFSDRSVLFNHGEIVAEGRSEEILIPELVDPIFNINSELIETKTGNYLRQY
ncbi:ABC superfamily ATP binding cassette transporter, ABC protein [Lactobacillus intestinalis DSM 6629]|uniref:ABC superfamily ATP binding cassette transporter, ABC protein n=1 Tax=Lactobacillus intestinalis DSM 6629 TaxID=1423761 RepID=A0ABR5PPG7_9LACO|nr:ABC superfamily ATP binding cassette transporter, ABC protein [Lactobacillus intestinalis DSM 6629]